MKPLTSLAMAVDYYDLVMISDDLFDEEPIDRMLGEFAERGVNAIQWRVSVLGKLLYHTKTVDRFAVGPFGAADIPGFAAVHQPIYEKCQAIMAKMDPMEVAVRLCRKHGLKVYPWLTIYDDAGYHSFTWSELIRKRPELCWKSIDGDVYYHGVTSYVYPEVVQHRLAQIKELLSYEGDGVYLSIRSHSRPPGYIDRYLEFLKDHTREEWAKSPMNMNLSELCADCERRFGYDPPAANAYRAKMGRNASPDDVEWWRFRGEYLVDFLKNVHELVKRDGGDLCFGPKAVFNMFPKEFFPWKRLMDERVVDELHIGATPTRIGADDAPDEMPELYESPGRKNYFFSVKNENDANHFINVFESTGNGEFLDRFDGLTIFEAFHFLLKPELWKFVEYLKNMTRGRK